MIRRYSNLKKKRLSNFISIQKRKKITLVLKYDLRDAKSFSNNLSSVKSTIALGICKIGPEKLSIVKTKLGAT